MWNYFSKVIMPAYQHKSVEELRWEDYQVQTATAVNLGVQDRVEAWCGDGTQPG